LTNGGPRQVIPKDWYRSSASFEEEMRLLFGRGWHFVGMSGELENDRDFVCLEHHGASIVVQNFKGELKAFQNVCTHRFNKIQTEERGNRPLSCRYHGWTYDRTGFPAGMPKREQFLTGDDATLCLTSYPVEACGKFVFVRTGEGVGLREQLGGFYQVLEDFSAHIGAQIHYGTFPHAANWKLLVENVLECYHCGVVHRDSFIPMGIGREALDEVVTDSGHSSCHFPRLDQPREQLRQRYLSHLKDRGLTHNSLYHIHVFPNLFVSSPEGLAFYVGQALPLGPGETLLRTRLFEPAVELGPKERARQGPINETSVAMTVNVIDEDRVILENIQKAMRFSDKPGRIGGEEVRIRAFHDHYLEQMHRGAD
jgi:phenylpropionate dioxygenase-like ring-hydroxylating dioxygenase large terminal subunit